MTVVQLLLLISAILFAQVLSWLLILRWIRRRTGILVQRMRERCGREPGNFVIEPQPALFRGSDAKFGNIRGNGVIGLTEEALLFEKLTGQRIEIRRTEISSAMVADSFRGKPSAGTRGRHLVIRIRDGNRVGFLLQNAEQWAAEMS